MAASGWRDRVLQSVKPIHTALRGQKLDLFFKLTGRDPSAQSLLDIGGGVGIAGEFLCLYRSFNDVTVVNIRPLNYDARSEIHLHAVVADGCALPFSSRTFDWVFSNAVIEHVGSWERQKLFANEVRRVARKGYFVTTPNRYFPIEPHTLLPFYQFLPSRLQRRVVQYSPGYVTEWEEIYLLSARQLRRLFPEAQVTMTGFPIIGNSLVAFHRAS